MSHTMKDGKTLCGLKDGHAEPHCRSSESLERRRRKLRQRLRDDPEFAERCRRRKRRYWRNPAKADVRQSATERRGRRRHEKVPDGDPAQCRISGCRTRITAHHLCEFHYGQWRRGTLGRPPGWTLREDGIIDAVAVMVAAHGWRKVRLTRRERDLAVAKILAAGGGRQEIADNLGVKISTARTLMNRVTRVGADSVILQLASEAEW